MPLACLADDAEAPGFVESVLEQAGMPTAARIAQPKTMTFKTFLSIIPPVFYFARSAVVTKQPSARSRGVLKLSIRLEVDSDFRRMPESRFSLNLHNELHFA
jgi:hypothetical protein